VNGNKQQMVNGTRTVGGRIFSCGLDTDGLQVSHRIGYSNP